MEKLTIAIIRESQHSAFCQLPCLLQACFEVVLISHLSRLLDTIAIRRPLLVLIDSAEHATWDGVAILQTIRQAHLDVPVILIASQLVEDRLIHAVRLGVNDIIKAPFTCEQIVSSVQQILTKYYPELPCPLPGAPAETDNMAALIGRSPSILAIKRYLRKVALTESTVLITGETGTGKELVAELIYQHSQRRHAPFVRVNCAALPEHLIESELFGHEKGAFTGATAMQRGKFELAHEGTLFLDEIGDMPLAAQAKILRALENKEIYRVGSARQIPIDVRVIAATHCDLEALGAAQTFRSDLYYRLNVARLQVPALRDRKEDVPLLLAHYIHEMNLRFQRHIRHFTTEALTILLQYHWPGNVRELRNIVEAAFIQLPETVVEYVELPAIFRDRLRQTAQLPDNERDRLLNALWATNWNKSKAAEQLSWSRMTVYRKMQKYQIAEHDDNGVL